MGGNEGYCRVKQKEDGNGWHIDYRQHFINVTVGPPDGWACHLDVVHNQKIIASRLLQSTEWKYIGYEFLYQGN